MVASECVYDGDLLNHFNGAVHRMLLSLTTLLRFFPLLFPCPFCCYY